MPIALDFNLIKEIIQHGAIHLEGEIVDPSTSQKLCSAGVAMVTTYIEQLSMLNLVKDPFPMFGKNGGMWIGFKLSETGRNLANSEDELRRIVGELIGGPKTEVSESVLLLQKECEKAKINAAYRDDFLKTIDEIRICFDEACYIATIGLCGKILEVCLKEILYRNEIVCDPNAMVGNLLKSIKEKLPSEYLDPSLQNVANIINASRITAVHAKEKIPVPSRDQAIMVIFATRDLVLRNLSKIN
ncbi:MAG: hypothetical protein JPMHGGIA_02758 [Saprospiraceae bacterium]|nr:hypothetical protein [Saprospiraceae bacterium]